jgi:hypothetical protein
MQEKAQMCRKRKKPGGRLARQRAPALLRGAIGKAEKGRSYPEGVILGTRMSGRGYEVAAGVFNGPEIADYVDTERP